MGSAVLASVRCVLSSKLHRREGAALLFYGVDLRSIRMICSIFR